ncbi:MAG: preprotein translocase subunit SecG [Candidatus Desulfatibia sp.]|uniref:preprotein translocase subunit SecG n=1 Tax=Candidatus Desulfatibia sp. TaxID=3101189 RepID=UPI002F31A352
MGTLLIIMHVIVSIALIMIVLLQTGKGADMGAAFGGGASQTLFGSTGASTFLGKATTVVAVLFMLTSLALAYRSGLRTGDSIMVDKKAPFEQQALPAIPAAPDQGVQPAAEAAPPLQPAQAGKGTQK